MEYQYFEYSAHLIFLDCTNGSRPVPPPIQWLSKSAPGFYKTIAVADDEIECFIQYPSISLVSLCDRDKDRGDDDDDDIYIYIMMKCMFVCHEKSSLPNSEPSAGGSK